jgi:dTDP-4-dehydrorhamnose 3,5-epimerase-like enzyme
MAKKIQTNQNFNNIGTQPLCIQAVFYEQGNNPFLPLHATDDRGTFFGLEYTDTRPFLVEIIHSNPDALRGNHIHRHCTEIFTVLTGNLDMYLLCGCPKKHLYKKTMRDGSTVSIPPGIAHAVYVQTKNESIAIFYDNDPRYDRERMELISIK